MGRSDDQLLQRLADEPRISGASTFSSLEVANRAVQDVLSANEGSIEDFLAGARGRTVLAGRASGVVGRYVARGSTEVRDVSGVRLVLIRDATMTSGYRVHTAFAEP